MSHLLLAGGIFFEPGIGNVDELRWRRTLVQRFAFHLMGFQPKRIVPGFFISPLRGLKKYYAIFYNNDTPSGLSCRCYFIFNSCISKLLKAINYYAIFYNNINPSGLSYRLLIAYTLNMKG